MDSSPQLIPYHRLGATIANRWWRTVLGTLLVLVGGLVLAIVVGVAGYVAGSLAGRPDGPDGVPTWGPLADLTITFVSIAVWLPLIFAAAHWFQRRPGGTLSSVVGRLRWRWLATCLPIAFAAVGLSVGGGLLLLAATGEETGLGDPLAGWGPFLVSMAVLLVVVPWQAAAEEYAFRGWLLQAAGTLLRRPWVPIAVQALVFAAMHGWGTPWGFGGLVVFGALAGWLTVRTGGIEAAIALHVANNLTAAFLASVYGQLTATETAADMPWQAVLIEAPVLLVFALVIDRLARRRRLAVAYEVPVVPAPRQPLPVPSLG
jgi:membrane protease YdiL (CAAX protease family)